MFKEINERELGLSGVVAIGWSVYCQKIKAIAMISLLVHIPINIIHHILIRYVNSSEYVTNIINIFEYLLGMIAVMGIVVIVENTVENESIKIGWRAALRKAFSRWGSALGAMILYVLIIFWPLFLFVIPGFVIGEHLFKMSELMLLLVIPGFIWGVYYILCYIFVIHVVTLHRIGGKTALNYSKSLVKWRWWKILSITVVLTLINVGLDFVIGYSSSFLPAGIRIIMDFFTQIVDAFSIVAITVLFLNLDYISDKIGY